MSNTADPGHTVPITTAADEKCIRCGRVLYEMRYWLNNVGPYCFLCTQKKPKMQEPIEEE